MRNMSGLILIDLEPFKQDPKGELTIVISEKQKEKNSSIILKESDKKIIL